jgi:hypothetical protein
MKLESAIARFAEAARSRQITIDGLDLIWPESTGQPYQSTRAASCFLIKRP